MNMNKKRSLPAAVQMGRRGGFARAKRLSAGRRSEIARLGGKAGGRGRPRAARIPPEVKVQIEALFEECKNSCLWFVRREFPLNSRAQARALLNAVMTHGNREQYIKARGYLSCLY